MLPPYLGIVNFRRPSQASHNQLTQKPPQRHHPPPILHRRTQQRHTPKAKHQYRQHPMRAYPLPQHRNRRRKQHVGHEKNTQHDVVLAGLKVQIHIHLVRLRVPQVALVQRVEEVHEGQHGEDADVEFERETLFVLEGGEVLGLALERDGVVGIGGGGVGGCEGEGVFRVGGGGGHGGRRGARGVLVACRCVYMWMYIYIVEYVCTLTIQYTNTDSPPIRLWFLTENQKKRAQPAQTTKKPSVLPPLYPSPGPMPPRYNVTYVPRQLDYLSSRHDGNPAAANHSRYRAHTSCNPSLPHDRTRDTRCEHRITFRRCEWTARWTVGSSRILVSGDKGEGRWEDGREAGLGSPGRRDSTTYRAWGEALRERLSYIRGR